MKRLSTVGGIGIALLLFSVPQDLRAHATPITYTPGAGATELATPERVTIYFSERIEPDASGIKVFSEDGSEVHAAHASLDPNDPRIFSVPLDEGGAGVYTVSWQVVSVDDGHFTRGSYSFLVDSEGRAFEGNAGSVQVTYVTKFSDVVITFVGLLGESLIIGALGVALMVLPRLRSRIKDARTFERIRGAVYHSTVLGALLLVLGSVFTILTKANDLAGLRGESLVTAAGTYLGSTGGLYTGLKIFGGVAILAVLFVWRRADPLRRPTPLVLLSLSVLCIVFFQSKLSHAAASFFYPDLSVAVTAGHLLFKEVLVGGVAITALLFIMSSPVRGGGRALLLLLYDRLAALALALAGVTGGYITWLHLKHPDNLVSTEWGERFVLLLAFGLILGCFRMFHQFVLSPRVGGSVRVARLAAATLTAEAVVASAMLFYSGFIAMTTPPFTVEQYTYGQEVQDGNVAIVLDAHPYESGKLRIRAFDTNSGGVLPITNAIVTVSNSGSGIEANVVATDRRAENSFAFPMSALSPSGDWRITATLRQDGAFDTNANFALTYPEDIASTRYSDSVRTFDDFAVAMTIVSLLLGALGVALFAHTEYRLRRGGGIEEVEAGEPLRIPHVAIFGVLAGFLLIISALFLARITEPAIKTACREDGFSWQQAFPAREFAVTSPNSFAGCYVHDGHYHLIDYDEYRHVLEENL